MTSATEALMRKYFEALEKAFAEEAWVWSSDASDQRFLALTGKSRNWRVLVCSFAIEEPLNLGYDGTATSLKYGVVLHLPREFAEKVFKLGSRSML